MKQIKELEARLGRLGAGPEADRERIDLMDELARRYVNVDSKKALEQALEAQRLARVAKYDKGLAVGMWIEGLCHFWHGDYPLAIARCRESLKMSEVLRDVTGQANANNVIGSSLLKLGEHAQALIHHLKSLKLWQEADDAHGLATIYNNLGSDYSTVGDSARALEYYQKSLKLKREADDPMSEASTLMNIGAIYENLENHSEALEYYHQSQKLFEEAGDARQGFALNNIGAVYEKLREFQNALSCYQKSLKLAQQQGYRQAEASILTNIGVAHYELGQHQLSEEYLRRSLAIAEEINEKSIIAENLIALGELYGAKRSFLDAVKPLGEGLAIAERIKSRALLARAYLVMFTVHKQWEKYQEALAYYEKYVTEEKEDFNESSRQKMQNLAAQCEVSKYQKETEFFRHKSEELERANTALEELNARLKAADEEKGFLLRKLEEQNSRLEGMVTEDAQTGLYNKRALRDKLRLEIARTRRYGKPLTVAMAEIDSYAEIAGKLPAQKAEQMIRALTRIFRENLRLVDIVARHDEHTFVFVFPETAHNKALAICERLQKMIVKHEWKQIHPYLAVSVSVGLTDDPKTDDPDKLILGARVKLAQAEDKGAGRIAF